MAELTGSLAARCHVCEQANRAGRSLSGTLGEFVDSPTSLLLDERASRVHSLLNRCVPPSSLARASKSHGSQPVPHDLTPSQFATQTTGSHLPIPLPLVGLSESSLSRSLLSHCFTLNQAPERTHFLRRLNPSSARLRYTHTRQAGAPRSSSAGVGSVSAVRGGRSRGCESVRGRRRGGGEV